MNSQLREYAIRKIKDDLKQCTPAQQLMFKRMYAGGDLEKPLHEVVDQMTDDKINRALDQVAATLKKNASVTPVLTHPGQPGNANVILE